MKRLSALLALLTSVLALTACAAATVEPVTPTAAPSDTPPPTASPPPTETATPSPFPTWPPPSPTPDFMDTPIVNGYLLAPSADPDCQLPCWQGLRIGESNIEDAQMMFRETMGINDDLRVLPEIFDIPATEAIRYKWIMEDNERDIVGGLSLYAFFDQETGILTGIRIDISSYDMYETYTPQQVIRELGRPSAILADYQGGLVKLILIYYDKGIVSLAVTEVIMEQQVIENETKVVANYCLNKMSFSILDHIVEPFNDIAEASLTPLQNTLFGGYVRSDFPTVEKAFGLTVDEFVEIALDDDNPCIELD